MHDSERRHAEKDAALRKMRSEKDEAARNAQDRISRLENNVRVLCQNIENSNSIMVMRKSSGVLLGDPDGDVDESFKLRRMDLAKMGVAEDQDDEERQRSILQQAGTVAREDHESETAFEAAKGRRAELLREEMQRWHVGQQMGKSGGGGAETACAEIRDSEGSDHAPPKVSDARRRYLESMQREALKLAQKNQHRKKKVARKGIAREAGEPYKTRPPLKKSTKKREEGGRKTVFG